MCRYSNAKLLVITIVTPAKNSQGVEHYVMTGQPALQIDAFAYYFEMQSIHLQDGDGNVYYLEM